MLLDRFVRHRDEEAFAALVRRHGPMVLAVCRRVLADPGAADDAFQATFCVLARRATSVRPPGAVAAWLHGVACRVALKARADGARHQRREKPTPDLNPADCRLDPLAELTARELLAAVDEEVRRLPEVYRLPVLLCCLEGRTREEAARLLGWTPGSVKGRLERGRARLHARLARRGLTLAAALAAVEAARGPAPAGVSALLAEETVRAALAFAAGPSAARATVSKKVVLLAGAGLKATPRVKVAVAALLLAAGLVLAGTGVVAHKLPSTKQPEREQQQELGALPTAAADLVAQAHRQARTDRYGDPLPDGAVARLGTVRFRHPSMVSALSFTPDGKALASACWDGTVRLWDPTTGRQTGCFRRGGPNPIPGLGWVAFLGVALSPDGKALIAVENFDTARVWDLATGQELHALKGRNGFGIALSPDGKTLAVGTGGDRTQQVALWDLTNGKCVRELGAATRAVAALAFSLHSEVLAAGDSAPVGEFRPGVDSGASTVRLWDAAAGRQLLELEGHTGGVTAVAFAPDGRTLVSASHDATLRYWDPATGKQIRKIQVADDTTPDSPPDNTRVRGIHYGGVLSLAFSPDGRVLASGSADGTVRLWDAGTGRELHALRGHGDGVTSVVFSPDGKVLASGSWDHTIRTWDPATGKPLQPREGPDGPVNNLAVSPDGRLAAAACSDRTIRLWSLATSRQLQVLRGHTSSLLYQLAFTPDGSAIVSGSADHIARVWDATTGQEVGGFANRPGWVTHVAPLPGHNSLLTAGPGRTLRVWDWSSGQELRQIAGISGDEGLQLSSDGSILAASDVNAVRLLDPATGKELRRFDASRPHFALSPDGRMLAIHGSGERQIHLASVATGEEIIALADQDWSAGFAGVAPYVFSPDGRLLARVGTGGTIELWDVLSGKVRRRFRGHQAVIVPLAFTPDGKTLLSGSEDTTVLIWDVARRLEERPDRLSEAELQGAWRALAGDDAEEADRAVWTLVAKGGGSLPFLRRHVRPARVAEAERLARLIADLDNDGFTVRERAMQELELLGEQAEVALRQALKKSPSPEAHRRVERLLGRLRGRPPAPDLLRSLRAVEVLEHVGTPEARELLETLARGTTEARLTQEAKAALDRLAGRPAASP